MISRRDVVVALIAASATVCVFAGAKEATVLRSSAFDWTSIPAKTTDVGTYRQFLRAPTATLKELELHVTSLNPGSTSHPPHTHPNEEMVIIKEGTVEALVSGEWKRLGPGSVIFNASNDLHGLKNVGSTPAVYHVIDWTSSDTPKAAPKP